ncbi:MAG: hypothetical protein ACJARG_001104, partial [Arcticibacterium sp.]
MGKPYLNPLYGFLQKMITIISSFLL